MRMRVLTLRMRMKMKMRTRICNESKDMRWEREDVMYKYDQDGTAVNDEEKVEMLAVAHCCDKAEVSKFPTTPTSNKPSPSLTMSSSAILTCLQCTALSKICI